MLYLFLNKSQRLKNYEIRGTEEKNKQISLYMGENTKRQSQITVYEKFKKEIRSFL